MLGEYLASNGKTQLRIAETEKYAHVTFFFNGGVEEPYEGEDRILIPSPKVATYDLKPEMSAYEVTEEGCEAIRSGKYDMMILNFANCDMVGHTGVFDAAVKAVEAVDACVERFGRPFAIWAAAVPDRRPRQRRQDGKSGRHAVHRAHHQPGSVPGRGLRQREAARGRLSGGYRADHAALHRSARAEGNDRQEHHRRLIDFASTGARLRLRRRFADTPSVTAAPCQLPQSGGSEHWQ